MKWYDIPLSLLAGGQPLFLYWLSGAEFERSSNMAASYAIAVIITLGVFAVLQVRNMK